ncbi:Pectin acetylesterase 9, partial [Zea mays]
PSSFFSDLLTSDDVGTLARRTPWTAGGQEHLLRGSSSPVLLDARERARTGSSPTAPCRCSSARSQCKTYSFVRCCCHCLEKTRARKRYWVKTAERSRARKPAIALCSNRNPPTHPPTQVAIALLHLFFGGTTKLTLKKFFGVCSFCN